MPATRVASSVFRRCRRRIAIRRRARQRALGVEQLFLFDRAIELEPPQVAEHRARLRGEAIGFRLQRANAPPRALGLIAVRVGRRLRERSADDSTEHHGTSTRCTRCTRRTVMHPMHLMHLIAPAELY